MTAGLLTAVAVGVCVTLILVLKALARVRVSGERRGDVLIARLGGPLYTANADATAREILQLAAKEPGLGVVVLDASQLDDISVTVLGALADLDRELAAEGIELRLAALAGEAGAIAAREPWFSGLDRAGRAFPSVEAAVAVPPPNGSPASDALAQSGDPG